MYAVSELPLFCTNDKASQSPYFALLCDGGTDITVENHMMVYIRYRDMLAFEFVTSFLCCVKVTADDADHQTAVLTGIMESLGLDASKLVAVCTDGARNCAGSKAGVVKQLTELHNPFLVGVHCAAHRPASVLNDAAKEFQRCLGTVDSLLKGVHGLFAHSHKRQEEWNALAKQRRITESSLCM